MARSNASPDELENVEIFALYEGGSVSLASKGENYYITVDESALMDIIDEGDSEEKYSPNVYDFDSKEKRDEILQLRYARHGAG